MSSLEIQELKKILGKVFRSPAQINALDQSDCEIVKLKKNLYLASTVDSVAEEIVFGLYQDPYTMGWVTAAASLSDLAAVGANPLGLLFSAQWAFGSTPQFKKRAAKGFQDALKKANTFLLGGDSGESKSTVLSSVGLGLLEVKPLSRLGLKLGDHLVVTGKIGCGPAWGFQHVIGNPENFLQEEGFRPLPRLKQAQKLRPYANAAIDLSDGLARGLQTLAMHNSVGFDLEFTPTLFEKNALMFCEKVALPPLSLAFGEHGDFELLLGIPDKHLKQAKRAVPTLIEIGRVVPRKAKFQLKMGARQIEVDLGISDQFPKTTMAEFKSAVEGIAQYARNWY